MARRLCLLLLAALAALPAAGRPQPPAGDTLRIGLVLPDSAARTPRMRAAGRGVTLGVEEAARSAALFGRAVVMVEGADAARLVREGRVQALLGGFAAEECIALGDVAERSGVLFLNLGCAADELRGRRCRASAFHVAPSESMLADALPPARVPGGAAAAWDSRLERFGAGQLNQRFRARFGEEMDSQGWVGWFAVKVLWESTLRARSTLPIVLRQYLRSDAAQFDGHKGRPLSFRRWDHQLRQPLYVSTPRTAPVEVPRAPADPDVSSRDFLDRLGTARSRSTCRFNG